jgi:osmoprotectant transport system permease protein
VLKALTAELKRRDGVVVLGSLGFENAYAFVMRPDRAKTLGVASIADLARVAPKLTLGSDLEFLSRPEWKAVQGAYGLNFKTAKSYQPTFMYRALAGGEADAISAFSSDGRIAADKLVILTDPKGAIPPYDAVVLISPRRAGDRRLLDALQPLIGKIGVPAMQAANYSVDRDSQKASPAEAARALEERLGR